MGGELGQPPEVTVQYSTDQCYLLEPQSIGTQCQDIEWNSFAGFKFKMKSRLKSTQSCTHYLETQTVDLYVVKSCCCPVFVKTFLLILLFLWWWFSAVKLYYIVVVTVVFQCWLFYCWCCSGVFMLRFHCCCCCGGCCIVMLWNCAVFVVVFCCFEILCLCFYTTVLAFTCSRGVIPYFLPRYYRWKLAYQELWWS